MNKLNNIFKFNILNIFKNKHIKIYPIGNRKRSKTEYDIPNYKNTLQMDFSNKMENKRNKKNISLRIRGSSF